MNYMPPKGSSQGSFHSYDDRQVNHKNYCFKTFPSIEISKKPTEYFEQFITSTGKEMLTLRYFKFLCKRAKRDEPIIVANHIAADDLRCSIPSIERAKARLKEDGIIRVVNNGKWAWNNTRVPTIKLSGMFVPDYARNCLTKLIPAFAISRFKNPTIPFKGSKSPWSHKHEWINFDDESINNDVLLKNIDEPFLPMVEVDLNIEYISPEYWVEVVDSHDEIEKLRWLDEYDASSETCDDGETITNTTTRGNMEQIEPIARVVWRRINKRGSNKGVETTRLRTERETA